MHEHQSVDLSALDPTEDSERWRAFVDATMLRVDAVLAGRPKDPLSLIAGWSRPVTLVSLVVLALLVPVEILLERREIGAEQVDLLVRLSAQSAIGEDLPSGAELSRVLGQDTLP